MENLQYHTCKGTVVPFWGALCVIVDTVHKIMSRDLQPAELQRNHRILFNLMVSELLQQSNGSVQTHLVLAQICLHVVDHTNNKYS